LLESTIATVLAEGGAHALFFVGEAGIGKSRLARWGLAEVERTGAMEGAAGGYDATGSGAAGGLRHALGRLLGAPPPRGSASKPDPALEAWRWLAALATSRSSRPPRGSDPGEAELDLALLGRFVRADAGQETSSAEAIARTAHAALRAFGRMRPIYLWLDDVAWSNDGALPLIERLLDTNDTPIVVVGTLRTAARAASPQLERLLRHPRASTRTLGGLDPTALTTLAERTLPLAPGVAEVIAGQMPSSPLLLVSALREWMERGVLVPGPEGYALADAHVEASSLSHLLSRRLERFAASFGSEALLAEEVMVRAALLGARFERSALRASTSQRPELHAIVERVLDHALVLGILRADAGELWSFEHGLLHEDVLARDVVDGREARIDVANALHERYGRERADVAFHVAHLLHEAGLSDHAWARLFVAIERAAWAGDDAAALRALASAERWSEADPSQRGRVALARARVHYYALRYDEALPACEACVRAAREAGDVTLALRARTMFADLAYYRDCFATARAVVLEVMAALDHDDPDHAAIASACAHRLGDLEIVRGDLAAALAHRERVVELAREAQQSWRVRITQLNVAELLVAMGRADEARTLAEQCAADAREEQDADGLEAAHDALRHIAILTGDAASGRATNVQQILRAEAHRDLWRLTAALLEEAVASALLDPPSEVGPAVEAFLQAFRRVPHHDGFAVYGFELLERTLEARGLRALAGSVMALRLERRAQLAAGFSR
ncbi:MAG: AAA family ATPase, partial [Sandaracinaceae bacterium]|nr:AAA family ATPase [Sandaracinaceae bacterium]